MIKKILQLTIVLICLLFPSTIFASTGGDDIVNKMMILSFQIGVIILCAKVVGILFEKVRMPSVLGELFAGILIGPYLLGKIPLPGFHNGLFGDVLFFNPHSIMPVSPELYGLATLASILLLFMAGLETDLKMFLKFSVAGSLVGIGGVIGSFIVGTFTAVYFMNITFMDPRALFLGVMSTATSVGITARILSERRAMASPEGVTIIAGAVIDDVLGIIILAIVLGISSASVHGGFSVEWNHIGQIALKALGVWIGFTFLGLFFADKIAFLLKKFNSTVAISTIAFGLALILAGLFEQAGLAMIIGSYIMGLSLSKTDLSYTIQHTLQPVQELLVPIFFVVSGMMVNPFSLTSKSTLLFGAVYTLGAIVSKVIGCGIPSYFLKFNTLGAIRIGLGMVPRGEVALIIASIGLSNGVLNDEMFGIAIMMTLITTLISPPILNKALSINKSGLSKELKNSDTVELDYSFPTGESIELVLLKIVKYFKDEGFFITEVDDDSLKYFVRRDDIFLVIYPKEKGLKIELSNHDVSYIKTLVYESLIDLKSTIEKLQHMAKPNLVNTQSKDTSVSKIDLSKIIKTENIILEMRAENKNEVIMELLQLLYNNGYISNIEEVYQVVMERERSMSTGMQYGLALPHGKSTKIKELSVAIGIKKDGIEFDALDGELSKVFVMVLSDADSNNRHIQVLAGIGTSLSTPGKILDLMNSEDKSDVISFFV